MGVPLMPLMPLMPNLPPSLRSQSLRSIHLNRKKDRFRGALSAEFLLYQFFLAVAHEVLGSAGLASTGPDDFIQPVED